MKTMEFNTRHVRLEETQAKALRQMFGRLTLEFTRTHCRLISPPYVITAGENRVELEGTKQTFPYRVLASTDRAVAIKTVDNDSEELIIWHFEGDHMWTYVGHSRLGWMHLREYFKRDKTRTNEEGGNKRDSDGLKDCQ